ncbi:hypothetical protein J7U46_22390 [Pelomonas sp. V22]|uniref:hypothetical protein n=1 Tax=Pelomonas sp. V22 TaxID=2822139 RepID=UPI0024A7C29D|nr:hypothetical protein [Pelomonas sp. V22]MDI4635832.1 hypothetical protein [Pelomonas sp. V22]
MKKLSILIAVVSLIAAMAAYVLWPLTQASEPSQNDSEPRMPSLLAAGSGATASTPVTAPAFAAAASGPAFSASAYTDYLEHKGTLRALAHKATSSNDPGEIEMAKLYLQRCLMFPKPKSKHQWIESPDAMRANAPKAAAAFEGLQAFCSDIVNQRDRNLVTCLSDQTWLHNG